MKKYLLCLQLTTLSFFCFGQDVNITHFKTSNELKDSIYTLENKMLTLDYRKSHILIAFEDSSAISPAYFEIQLEGFDKKWHKIGTQTYANYINLFGGKYEFKVRNVKYPLNVASVKFEIEAAFWQQTWFIPSVIAYLLLIAGVIFYFFQTARLKEQIRFQDIRNSISADLHDDVGATLSNISFLAEMAKGRLNTKPQDLPMLLNKIGTDTKEMIQTMRGLIWSMSPNNDTAQDFFDKVRAYISEILNPHNVEFNFDIKLPENLKLNVEIQRNVFLVCKEAVNNVTKYAKASLLTITIRKEKEWLMIQLKDNGQGFTLDTDGDGNGLRNMRDRIEQLGGSFELITEPSQGVKLRATIPLT